MMKQEEKLSRILDMKFRAAEARLVRAREVSDKLQDQIQQIAERRSQGPDDPADQLFYERHVGWLDHRARELGVLAAQAAAEFTLAKDALRIEFGRKAAFAEALLRRGTEEQRRASRQLS
jgi:hypothetical protein